MKENYKHIESLGILTKEVTFSTVKDNIVPNTLVLETLMPYPGYHGEYLPTDTKPEDIFLIANKKYPTDFIFRIIKKVKKFINVPIDATPCDISIYNDRFFGIRIRNLEEYYFIQELQQWFMDEGISPLKYKNIDAPGIVNLKKIFTLERMDEGIFQDLDDTLTYYLEIPSEISWSLFRKITFTIKNNIDNRNFDAARAYIYFDGITDFVRIYITNTSLERLQGIRKSYHSEIKKFL